MPEMDEIELRSEEVQEILGQVPHWMIRWGSVLVFAIILMMFFVSWIVKYPDIISSPIVITTTVPPQKLVAKTSGKIETILVKDKAKVAENTPMAIIENSADYKAVFALSKALGQAENGLHNFDFNKFRNARLGDVENAFALFQKEYETDELNDALRPYKVEGNAQVLEKSQLRERLSLLRSQKVNQESELELQKTDLERYEGLHKKGIVAPQELETHKLNFLQSERSYKSLLSNISQLQSSLNDLEKNSKANKINEQKENVSLERNKIQAFYQLKKAIKDWELTYVLRSSIAGQVSFLQVWTENQTVNAGDNVFAVVPDKGEGYIGKVKATVQNSGKIKVGQNVNIRLANYPDREFGIVKGIVNDISLTPDKDGNLLIDITLPEGLKTSYKKQIEFKQEMTGNADIITEEMRLIERFLYQFRDMFKMMS
ncbi:MAG: HlyD family secretion protein [Flavobacterium sp.]